MPVFNDLQFQPASRFDPLDCAQEGNKNIRFADVMIDGRSLYGMLRKHDLVPIFGWGGRERQLETLDFFLLRKPHESLFYRYPLLVCPWCGDEGCGFISVKVDREGERVIWKDFYAEHQRLSIPLGPFVFSWALYEQAILSTFEMFGEQ
ncbi:oxidoreductase [Paenibacillus athensensis]|uniref:Oxidoreductase n=1 Tax=Paenibacillus athensensis TaxID=1967502 RepID=A0A4Y8Q315_9BACL|nr:oxidoreductase [Paenibacillus athensensis]MCD1259239.1 oxidoreductase [Paenibacillus athensensis]